ncbi:MAG: hypothetical protein LWW93_18010 [Hyphomicrobiales bacterium]|nr:hypothetical protein [Hyphomicrobiales bacterium]
MHSSRTRGPTRLGARAAALAVAALGLGLLVGCDHETTLENAGATLSGRIRLAPLSEPPPAGRVTVQMLPFSGLPVTVADGIYRAFRSQAEVAGISLVHRLEDPAMWRVQGHFVALGGWTSTTFIYTYDIYDAAGRPIHRITGQETGDGVDGDPWGAATGGVQSRLARDSVRDLQTWLNRSAR